MKQWYLTLATQVRRVNDERGRRPQRRISVWSRSVPEYYKLDSLVCRTVRLLLRLRCGLRTILSHLLQVVHGKVEGHRSLLIHRLTVRILKVRLSQPEERCQFLVMMVHYIYCSAISRIRHM